MKRSFSLPLLLATLLLSISSVTHAQGMPLTREQVKMDRATFLTMFRWSKATSEWVLKANMAPPKGVMSREEVIAMRDKFLSMNSWDEARSNWVPLTNGPRDMSKLTREQVERETVMFLMTHRYDESSDNWVSKMRAVK